MKTYTVGYKCENCLQYCIVKIKYGDEAMEYLCPRCGVMHMAKIPLQKLPSLFSIYTQVSPGIIKPSEGE